MFLISNPLNLMRPILINRQSPHWRDGLTKPPSKSFDREFPLKEMLGQNWSRLKEPVIHLMGWHQILILLLMLCCAFRQEPSMAVFWEALPVPDWDRCRHLQPNIGMRSGTSMGKVGRRIKGYEGIGNPIGRPMVWTSLDAWQLSEPRPLTKNHTRDGLRALPHR